MSSKKIAVIVGSLRKGSFNKKTANALIKLAPESLSLEILDISNLPLYNEDLDINPPEAWTEFRNKLKTFDGVIIVTPEYNRSFPAAVKNAIDVGSRPYGESVWEGKTGAVISVSQGVMGGFGANQQVKQTLAFLNVIIMPQPEAYIGNAASWFDEEGNLTNESTSKFLKGFIEAYAQWVYKFCCK